MEEVVNKKPVINNIKGNRRRIKDLALWGTKNEIERLQFIYDGTCESHQYKDECMNEHIFH